ncbi:MAG: c-type cytochrome [Thermoleophilaceae bacterium]
MTRPRKPIAFACAGALAVLAGACGKQSIDVKEPPGTPVHSGAVLFNERCSGCHTLTAAAARGSVTPGDVGAKERTDGPNLDYRKENRQSVLFAIRNGGFSGAIMPANIVVGPQAQQVAEFVSKYAGSKSQGGGSAGSSQTGATTGSTTTP